MKVTIEKYRGGREGRREGGREGGRERASEGGREGGKEREERERSAVTLTQMSHLSNR